jgi:group I intron endonuclease
MSLIYKITSPSGKTYIGQTVDYRSRLNKYRKNNCANQVKLYNSLLKYGFEKHKFEVIVEGDFNSNLLNELEMHYIRIYNSFNNGLNLTEGGGGNSGFIHSDEAKLKMRLKALGNKKWLGKKHTQETKDKISKKALGFKRKPMSIDSKLKLSNSKSRKVVNIDTNEVYNSALELSVILNMKVGTLRSWLEGRRNKKSNYKYL